MLKLCFYFTVVLCVMPCGNSCESEKNQEEVFVPTNEWQVVKKGQKIPQGLHVKVNFETGITEAKLLDEREASKKENSLIVSENNEIESDQLKEQQFRTYDEIKQHLGELNLTPKTDAEILSSLFDEYHETPISDEEQVIRIIDDFEYLAHQYDNALEFIRNKGFNKIVYKNLNTTSVEIRKHTLLFIGSLTQNNPAVQVHAVKTGCLEVLQRCLEDKSDDIKIKTIYALGSILRRFPWAQSNLIASGGLVRLSKLFDSDNLRLRMKIFTLMTDMIEEDFEIREKGQEEDPEKYAQYQQVNLIQNLLNLEYCSKVNDLLIQVLLADSQDIDGIEKCLRAMKNVIPDCKHSYTKGLIDLLSKVQEDFDKAGDSYYEAIVTFSKFILSVVNSNSKTEL